MPFRKNKNNENERNYINAIGENNKYNSFSRIQLQTLQLICATTFILVFLSFDTTEYIDLPRGAAIVIRVG